MIQAPEKAPAIPSNAASEQRAMKRVSVRVLVLVLVLVVMLVLVLVMIMISSCFVDEGGVLAASTAAPAARVWVERGCMSIYALIYAIVSDLQRWTWRV